MLGTIVNVIAVLLGSGVGLLLKKGFPQRIADTLMQGAGLVVVYIGISGALQGEKTLVAVVSIFVGAALGSLIDIDKWFNRLGDKAQLLLTRNQDAEGNTFAQGFVNASLLFCIGAMAVVGSLQSGLVGDHSTLFAKSIIDGVSSVVFASTMGPGVLLSALAVFLYQGAITVLAQFLAPLLTEAIVAEMTCVGSLLIIAIGLNLLNLTKIKVANFLPAIFLPILLLQFM